MDPALLGDVSQKIPVPAAARRLGVHRSPSAQGIKVQQLQSAQPPVVDPVGGILPAAPAGEETQMLVTLAKAQRLRRNGAQNRHDMGHKTFPFFPFHLFLPFYPKPLPKSRGRP